jgi:hypothetical protein
VDTGQQSDCNEKDINNKQISAMRTYFYLIKIGLAALLITFCYLGYSNDLIIPISLEERISKAELIV